MVESNITIINKLGLHARAAAKFVAASSAFSSKVEVTVDGNTVDGKSIMSVMILAACKGTTIHLCCTGEDEQQALAAITQLINNRFDEGE